MSLESGMSGRVDKRTTGKNFVTCQVSMNS